MAVDVDAQIGENVAAYRGEMSQKKLADAMRDAGHKWSQSTVWSVETGARPLKLSEASSLAEVLGVSVDNLLRSSDFRMLLQAAENQLHRLIEAEEMLHHAADKLVEVRAETRRWAREVLDPAIDNWANGERDEEELEMLRGLYARASTSPTVQQVIEKLQDMESNDDGEH